MNAPTLFEGLRGVENWSMQPVDVRASLARGHKALARRTSSVWMTTLVLGAAFLVAALGARLLVHASPPPPMPTEVDEAPPAVPQDLRAVPVGPDLVNLTWMASEDDLGVAGYTVYRDREEIATVDGSTVSYDDASVEPETEYRYRVDAFDEAGNHSEPSRPARVTTPRRVDDVAPSPPSGLTAEPLGSNAVELSWSPSTDDTGVAGYSIYRDGAELQTVDGLTTSFTDEDVEPATTYSYAVRAFDSSGNVSSFSNEVEVLTDPEDDSEPPTAPVVTVEHTGEGVRVLWEASLDNIAVTGYQILRNGVEIQRVDATAGEYLDTDDLCEGTYTYEVVAFDEAGNESPPGSDDVTIIC